MQQMTGCPSPVASSGRCSSHRCDTAIPDGSSMVVGDTMLQIMLAAFSQLQNCCIPDLAVTGYRTCHLFQQHNGYYQHGR